MWGGLNVKKLIERGKDRKKEGGREENKKMR